MTQNTSTLVDAAIDAAKRGYQPIPIVAGEKRPAIAAWTRILWNDLEEVERQFTDWEAQGYTNLGVLLGEPSHSLVDVDIDHPMAYRLRDNFLPPTKARSGRTGRRSTHWWYVCEPGTLPGRTRQHKMPDGAVSVELRSTLGQTVIAPSTHPSGDLYLWDFQPWGGVKGPTKVNGRVLAAQVALLGLAAVLLEKWPAKGSRHDAYLALAGGLLWYGDQTVHPFWERNIATLITGLCDATNDDAGPDERYKETVESTIAKIRAGNPVGGMGKLSEMIGADTVKHARLLIAEVESAAGFQSRTATMDFTDSSGNVAPAVGKGADEAMASEIAAIPLDQRDPLAERGSRTWLPVDLEPYLSGRIQPALPTLLSRDDGQPLMYPGRVNMLVGASESAKSWVALETCLQEMRKGQRVLFMDFEDEPMETLKRLMLLGASDDELRIGFTYVRPESQHADMERPPYGGRLTVDQQSMDGKQNREDIEHLVRVVDPNLIVADGMSVLYGLHGLDPNSTKETEVITAWLKNQTDNGKRTVIVIDHTNKGAGRGELPTGSQHKVSMVQGTLIQVHAIEQPRPGAVGQMELIVMKDRPGHVRAISSGGGSKAQTCGMVYMDSTVPDRVTLTIKDPSKVVPSQTSLVVDNKVELRAQQQRDVYDNDLVSALFSNGTTRLTYEQIGSMLGATDKGEPYLEWDASTEGYKGRGMAALGRLSTGPTPLLRKAQFYGPELGMKGVRGIQAHGYELVPGILDITD